MPQEEIKLLEPVVVPATVEFSAKNSDDVPSRRYVFAEFFAGMGGFSEAMKFMCADRVTVQATLDGYAGEWNILDDRDYDQAVGLCRDEIDHGHFAPPCRTLSRARRTDEHGSVPVLRDDEHPEGWGSAEAEEGNQIVARMVLLCLMLVARGATFAIENPWDSFIWLLKKMQKLLKLKDAELVCLHQCAYGASSRKATGILTTATWMKLVRKLCSEVRPHLHATSLSGHAWDYVAEKWVWRTSLAAEYPCGLCVSWCKALKCWLASKLGRKWLERRSYKVVGRWKNVLVRAAVVNVHANEETQKTIRDLREEENRKAVGGLRDPRSAVKASASLRRVGAKLRRIIEENFRDEEVEKLCENFEEGLSQTWVEEIRQKLGKEFQAEVKSEGLQADLLQAMLTEAEDVDAETLPKWIRTGFPLGISEEIVNTGVFPATQEDSAAVEASRLEGWLQDDADGHLCNYASFEEAGEPAEELLKTMEENGRSQVVDTWSEVCQLVGPDAKLTKLAWIVK